MEKHINLPETAIILAANLKGYDEDNSGWDILLEARRKYFATRKKVRDKVFFTLGIESVRCQYQISPNKPMKWKKTVNTKLTEFTKSDTTGSYILFCLDLSGEIRKKIFFSSEHTWLKTEYYNGNGVLSAQLTSYKSGDGQTVALSRDGSKPIILSAYNDKSLISCEQEVYVQTMDGDFYFAPYYSQHESVVATNTDNVKRKGFFFDESLIYGDFTTLNISKGIVQPKTSETEDEKENATAEKSFITVDSINSAEFNLNEKRMKGQPAQLETQVQVDDISEEDKSITVEKSTLSEAGNNSKIIQGKEKYYYYGTLNKDGQRHGGGVTLTQKGTAIYSGGYSEDKRSGFGTQFFKNGKICYVGRWSEDKKNGFGFSVGGDGTITAGNFENDKRKGLTAKFKGDGSLVSVVGYTDDGIKGLSFTRDNSGDDYLIQKNEGGKLKSLVTVLDDDGNIKYNGEMENGEYSGVGRLFDKSGALSYSGHFKNNLKNGEGTLYLDDGSTISGHFLNGELDGEAVHRSYNGIVIYKGTFKDNKYSGEGTLYRDDGSYCNATFDDGKETGSISVFSPTHELIYKGGLKNGEYSGKGTLYENNEKVYDGSFVSGKKSGMGRLFKDKLCVYMGSFENDKKSGFGISYKNNKAEYSGFWNDDEYNGCGLLHDSETNIDYAGAFKNGKMHGRINQIFNTTLLRECIYENGVCSYMREYDDDGSVVYEGSVVNSLREGMGCAYTKYGEKQFEGIFKCGEPYKSMRVIPKALAALEDSEQLHDTAYATYKKPLDFVSEKLMGKAIYSGSLKDGKPGGNGTLLYPDHRYTGSFLDGKPAGNGVLYFGDGKELKGEFFSSSNDDTTMIEFNDIVYYVKKSDESDNEQVV